MCDVPSIAVFCKESIECVPGIACTFFFKLRVTITVAPIIIGMIVLLLLLLYFCAYMRFENLTATTLKSALMTCRVAR